jgi:hypothetical protein
MTFIDQLRAARFMNNGTGFWFTMPTALLFGIPEQTSSKSRMVLI